MNDIQISQPRFRSFVLPNAPLEILGQGCRRAADGVHCIDPGGTLLGKILVPRVVANLTFGGRNPSRLLIRGSHTLFAIFVNKRGAQAP